MKSIARKFAAARSLCLFLIFGCILLDATVQAADTGRKPLRTVLQAGQDPTRITVKFRDGLNIRLRNNALVSTNAGLFTASKAMFDRLGVGKWERAETVDEAVLDDMRHRAEQNLGRALPDMNLQYYLTLPPGVDAGNVIDQLNQLDIVDLAQPVPRAMPAPLPPNFQPQQTYNNLSPIGGGAFQVWTNYGIFGSGIRIADVEYSFNASHQDLPAVDNLTPTAVDPFNDNNHGTAVMGEIVSLQNGWGTTGAAYDASMYFAGANYSSGYNVGAGITAAASALRAGDILLIEQQIAGPNTTQSVLDYGGEYGLIPVDWYEPYYNDVVTAVGLGIIVIETADNGGQNLDDPIYSTGNGGLWPFLPQNRSGAILVGAGAAYNDGYDTESSRLYYANYGSCVDIQNWGENLVSTGYGDLYSSEGANLYYTSSFGGTSGATPIVVAETALMQSIYKHSAGSTLTAPQIRALLHNTGAAQTGGAYPIFDNIGPLPNLLRAVQTVLSNSGPPVLVEHTTNAQALIGGNSTLSAAVSGRQPLTYQWSYNGSNLSDGGNVFGSKTADLLLTHLAAAQAGAYTLTATNSAGKITVTNALSVISPPWLTPGVSLSNLYSFTAAGDGEGPIGLTPDGSGNFFGVQQFGGTFSYGGIFEFTPADTNFTVLWDFDDQNDGAEPVTPMVLGSDGNFYGTTMGDGNTNYGSVFSTDTLGDINPLYAFTGGSDGGSPQGSLLEVTPELFYGTTYNGGSENQGVIFSIDSSSDFNVIHNFDFYNGAAPAGGLVLAGDGNYYGTTHWGGANNYGMIYRLYPNLTFSNLFSFNNTNGANPSGNLVVAQDGKLYGRTDAGGTYGQGTVFSISIEGAFQLLFSFAGTNGSNPHGTLVAGNDGNVYGATSSGGTNAQDGVIYEVTPTGGFSIVAYFNGDLGLSGYGPMVRNPADGNIYGTTFNGGNYGSGNIFELSFASTPPPVIQSVNGSAGKINLTCEGVTGRGYQLQSTTTLHPPDWAPVGNAVTASSTVFQTSDTLSPVGDKFYRLKLELP
jgi:uncharacterized repeat protein (TIGR03803 family)